MLSELLATDDFDDDLSSYVEARKRDRYDNEAPKRQDDNEAPKRQDDERGLVKRQRQDPVFQRLGPSKPCRIGRCNRMECSFWHGSHYHGVEFDFCKCTSATCDRPHPFRKRIKKALVCKKCGGDHYIYHCPKVQCNKCKRYGHLADRCAEIRR